MLAMLLFLMVTPSLEFLRFEVCEALPAALFRVFGAPLPSGGEGLGGEGEAVKKLSGAWSESPLFQGGTAGGSSGGRSKGSFGAYPPQVLP